MAHSLSAIKPLPPEADNESQPDDDEESAEEQVQEVADSPESHDAKESDAEQQNKFKRVLKAFWRRKLWTLPLTVVVVLALLGAVPASRYKVLAFFITKSFSVTVTDSTTGTPVSGATVKLGNKSAVTDSKGKTDINSPVGDQTLSISKTYYQGVSQTVLVDLSGTNSLSIKLVATGRQVPVKVINKITGQPIPEVVLTFGNTNARTDLNGQATVVLPTSSPAQDAVLTVDGYNNLSAKVQVTTQVVDANTFAMVPKGRLYFLSDLSGKVDVVSTNLDGSDRKTVLAGTGSEDKNNTVLLASRDWQYLALLSKRDGDSEAKLYLISTADGKLTTIDGTAGNISLVGWNNHYFVYVLSRDDVQLWQPNKQSIISYNADTNTPATLANTKSLGTSAADAQYQSFDFQSFLGSNVIYNANWNNGSGAQGVSGQQATLTSAKVDGTGSRTLESADAATSSIGNVNLANPGEIYFSVYSTGGSNYYRLDSNENITQSSTITADTVNQQYPTYLVSPSGKSTFWTSVRDGKNTLFVGDYDGNNGNQIASLSDYTPYGWYTDDYLLVQQNKSELYILPANGGTPQKISDYFKPDYSIYGYGGGYGGF